MKLALKILFSAVVFAAALLLLEKVYDFGLRHNRNLKLTGIRADPPCADLLVHGPCEPLWMISPALLDVSTGITSYNLALSHSDFADNYLHLYFYLKSNKAPKYLLLYITPESLDKRFNTFNTYRFAPYLSDSLVSEVVRENDPDYFKWTKIPFMKYAYYNNSFTFDVVQGFRHYISNRRQAYYPDGFEPPAKRAWGNHAGEFAELYNKNTFFKTDSLRITYLLKILKLAKDHGIRVYLYESPVLHEALAYQLNREEMIRSIKSIASSEKVPFIVFDQLPMAKEKKYFISTLNLNMDGVKIFNDTLAKFVRSHVLAGDTIF